jgi:hypothetical protein
MFSVNATLKALPPAVPVTVTVEEPAGAGFCVEIVSVELPGAVTLLGEKDALVWDGKFEALSATEPPPLTFTVSLPLDPRFTVSELAESESENTFTVTVAG